MAQPFNVEKIVAVLEAQKASLATDAADQEAILKEARARLDRGADDKKEAAKIAADVAKLFITIGAALFVAIGTFVQFAKNAGVPWVSAVIFCFAAGAALVLMSMLIGFSAISRIYKRADGRIDEPKGLAWSTSHVAQRLDWQGRFGLLSLVALVAGLAFWALRAPIQQTAVSVTIAGAATTLPGTGPLLIDGQWTTLKLQTAAGQEITLPGGSRPIALVCR